MKIMQRRTGEKNNYMMIAIAVVTDDDDDDDDSVTYWLTLDQPLTAASIQGCSCSSASTASPDMSRDSRGVSHSRRYINILRRLRRLIR